MIFFDLLNLGEGSKSHDLSGGRYIGHICVDMDVYLDRISITHAGTIDIKKHGTTIITAHSENGGYKFPKTEKLAAGESYGIFLKSTNTACFFLTWPVQEQSAYEANVIGESFFAEECIGMVLEAVED